MIAGLSLFLQILYTFILPSSRCLLGGKEIQSFIPDKYKGVVIILVICSNEGVKLTVKTFKSNFVRQTATTDTFLFFLLCIVA